MRNCKSSHDAREAPMRPESEFARLLDELHEEQRRRGAEPFLKAMVAVARATRRNAAEIAARRPMLRRITAKLEAMAAQTAAKASGTRLDTAAEAAGRLEQHRQARQEQARSIMAKAMALNAAGEITALDVARVTARILRMGL